LALRLLNVHTVARESRTFVNQARFHAGGSLPPGVKLPRMAPMEPRRSEREGSVRAPEIVSWLVHGWIGTPVPTARIAAASEQRVRPPLPLRQFEAQDTPRS